MPSFEDMPMPVAAAYTAKSGTIGEQAVGTRAATGPGSGSAPHDWTTEEMALVHIFRLVNQAAMRGTLTPIEQAFVVGARATLEMITEQCQQLLDAQALSELAASRQAPRSADSLPETTTRKKTSAKKKRSRSTRLAG